jgi:hypothetical protein
MNQYRIKGAAELRAQETARVAIGRAMVSKLFPTGLTHFRLLRRYR